MQTTTVDQSDHLKGKHYAYRGEDSYSISKAAALSLTQSLRALLKRQGVSVHAVIPGTIDTDMTRGYDVPKVLPEFAAAGIFDGVEKGEDIFPDPTSQMLADGWRVGVAKALERRINAVVLEGAQIDLRERLSQEQQYRQFERSPHIEDGRMHQASINREFVKRHFEAVNRRHVQTVVGNMRSDF